MKNILFFLSLLFSGMLFGQIYPDNSSCATAELICDNNRHTTYFNLEGAECDAGFYKVYYYVRCKQNSSSATIAIISTDQPSVVKVFGAYTNLQTACEQYNLLTSAIATTTSGTSHTVVCPTVFAKYLLVEVTINTSTNCKSGISFDGDTDAIDCNATPCDKCLTDFQLPVGKYVISAWAKEENAARELTSYTHSSVRIIQGGLAISFFPAGQIIEGWQKIEGVFNVVTAGSFSVALINGGTEANFFDDIRIFPFEGSMMSYVYDPLTLRLVAELDERNYAKFYEYDEEGKLIRVKKETEKGVSTIQESRNNQAGE